MVSFPIARFAAVCKQYGPGRLPYADRRAIGAGYAMSTTAAVAAVTFILVMQVPGIPEVLPTGSDAVFFGTIALPIVIPSAFVSGVLVWRSMSPDLSRSGSDAGLIATCLTYLFGTFIAYLVLFVQTIIEDPSRLREPSTGVEFLIWIFSFAPVIGTVSFIFTFWLTLPLGALGGSIYERTRQVS